MKKSFFTVVFLAFLSMSGISKAQSIASYDIENARAQNYGLWTNKYSGLITPAKTSGLFNYTGGSGTLNDGIVPNGIENTQMIIGTDNPVITLHLSEKSTIKELNFYSMLYTGNYSAGNLKSATISYGGKSVTVDAFNWGPTCSNPHAVFCNNKLDLSNTILNGVETDTIIISNFLTKSNYSPYYSIGEISLNGSLVSPVPEPGIYGMILAGLALIYLNARKKRKKAV